MLHHGSLEYLFCFIENENNGGMWEFQNEAGILFLSSYIKGTPYGRHTILFLDPQPYKRS